MNEDEPGVTLSSLLRMIFKRSANESPAIEESTCGHCKTKYNVNVGHMCPYIKELYSKLGEK
ncbi:hypothetical protein SEA_BATTUTA_131 [Streptomyces phage Battuta]|jgi:hypothetical protein|uniref:Uncharacterized protein n=1 Tax=Streptomyces phage Battuta TaxID=2805843 RepID=A0A890UY93_9CAUD|nr:hypothetical protein SEA_BIRCHLYN_131 [Streptomyces phage Birchlyn]QGH79135.1 hypothetical protein SEA_TOMSAWYER_133 [Streptomyces phage TomSawyer]QRI45927.1 hypothetical protein SEA_BATTUTA_131 [Streptomyces phage Battuta]URM86695.1 hypothetical protein SEA_SALTYSPITOON_132 [Streptomyces phage SaltySpitoon]URM87648.1 hypothetical protein SEA_QUARAN19_132 [Streptomyces phage Quaran19]UVK60969.1 hypothetical protein SEA_JIMJAM_135 [Streptomyces phage JimJam]WGH19911.1 hypothetical protein S